MSESRITSAGTAVVAAALFIFTWFLRYNDPGGSFAGLTDDHFFYLVRGWQILYGELPVRDFVDHGAPLFYYVGAAVQLLLGRGTWSEIAFCVTVLSLCSVLTFWLAARASGSIVFGLAGALFQILLDPRFYNYPKLLSYVLALPALWRFAERPTGVRRSLVALVVVIAFLFRHDHGVYVAAAFGALLLLLPDLNWPARARHAVLFGATVLLLLSPYLVFLQANGGVVSYFQHALAWAERDRVRAPLVWPPLVGNEDGNLVAWVFYLLVALPLLTTVLLAASDRAFRPDWPRATAKMGTVTVLAMMLNAGFLRHPLEGRLADPSVPHAILLAWVLAALFRTMRTRHAWRPQLRPAGPMLAAALFLAVVPVLGVFGALARERLLDRMDKASLLDGPEDVLERARLTTSWLRQAWPLERWSDPAKPGVMKLAFYLRDCTSPQDRVFMGPYLPQVLALSQRGFAGGHADLRRGFFNTTEAQQLTLERLQKQSVPVVVMGTEEYPGFRESFPLITQHLDAHYRSAGVRALDDRFSITLLVSRHAAPVRRYEPLDWPCFR